MPGVRTTSGQTLGMDFPLMPHNRRKSYRGGRSTLGAELLERRRLLSGAAPGHQDVAIQVPSAYISQQSSQLDVTLVRTKPSGRSDAKGIDHGRFLGRAITRIAAEPDSGPAVHPGRMSPSPSRRASRPRPSPFPINSGAANPGLVPMQLAVTSSVRQVKGSSTTVYLASSADAIPPSIIGVQRVAGGIAITFSKPMDPATVRGHPQLRGQVLAEPEFQPRKPVRRRPGPDTRQYDPMKIPLRRATYNPATNTVLLVATEQLGSKGSYQISNPASLLAKKARPSNAHPLTDLEGNVLDQGGKGGGTFSITIGKGKPYAATAPTLAVLSRFIDRFVTRGM